jgi:uncharacterized membrane protein
MTLSRYVSMFGCLTGAFLLLFFLPVCSPENPSSHVIAQTGKMLFAHVCHQLPEHSFKISSFTFPVCARCTGIYLGVFIGAIFSFFPRTTKIFKSRHIFAIFLSPILVDVITTKIHLCPYSLWIAFITGIIFGVSIFPIIVTELSKNNE